MNRPLLPVWAIVAGVLGALGASCVTLTEPVGDGSHVGRVTGAAATSFDGWAGFGAEREGWGVSMLPAPRGANGWSVHLWQRGPRPPAGTTVLVGPALRRSDAIEPYALGDVTHYVGPGPGTYWEVRSGWIRIIRSTPWRLTATFEVNASPPQGGNDVGPITVTGTFTAFCFLGTGC